MAGVKDTRTEKEALLQECTRAGINNDDAAKMHSRGLRLRHVLDCRVRGVSLADIYGLYLRYEEGDHAELFFRALEDIMAKVKPGRFAL